MTMTLNQALVLLGSDPQKGYREAVAVLRGHLVKLEDELKWVYDNMSFTDYPPAEDAEYEFCNICNKPEWAHKSDCSGIVHKKIVEKLLKGEDE